MTRVAAAVEAGGAAGEPGQRDRLTRTPEVVEVQRCGVPERLPRFDRLTAEGVAWDDGRFVAADTILWATGFRHALDHLVPLRPRGPGGGIGMDGTRVAADPRLPLVGHGPSAGTVGATRAGAAGVKRYLAGRTAPVG